MGDLAEDFAKALGWKERQCGSILRETGWVSIMLWFSPAEMPREELPDFLSPLGLPDDLMRAIPEGWNLLSLYNCMGGWEAELVGLGDEYGNFPSARGKAPTMARALAAGRP